MEDSIREKWSKHSYLCRHAIAYRDSSATEMPYVVDQPQKN